MSGPEGVQGREASEAEKPFHYRVTLVFSKESDSYASLGEECNEWLLKQDTEGIGLLKEEDDDRVVLQFALYNVGLVNVSRVQSQIYELVSRFHFSPVLEEFSERVREEGINGFGAKTLIPEQETREGTLEGERREVLQKLFGTVFLYEQKLKDLEEKQRQSCSSGIWEVDQSTAQNFRMAQEALAIHLQDAQEAVKMLQGTPLQERGSLVQDILTPRTSKKESSTDIPHELKEMVLGLLPSNRPSEELAENIVDQVLQHVNTKNTEEKKCLEESRKELFLLRSHLERWEDGLTERHDGVQRLLHRSEGLLQNAVDNNKRAIGSLKSFELEQESQELQKAREAAWGLRKEQVLQQVESRWRR